MFELKLGQKDIDALLTPGGIFHLLADIIDKKKPFKPGEGQLVSLAFNTGPEKTITLGTTDTVKLGLQAETDAKVLLLWPSSKAEDLQALKQFGLENYFTGNAHPDQLLIMVTIGASSGASAAADFKYSVLTAGATLQAGADAAYGFICPFAKDTAAETVLKDFFKELSLPAGVSQAPQPGEVLNFDYGGYLSFGADLGLGYQISGSPSQEIKDLKLSEHYKLSLLGKLGFQSKVAGRFNIRVSQGVKPGWARVKVQKSKNKDFDIAADVDMGGKLDVEGLPDSPDEFLEAVFGLKAKNWLNLFDTIKKDTDFKQIEAKLDNLSKEYITLLTGKAFEKLEDSEWLKKVIGDINKAIDSYHNLGNYAVSLFDRYYDPVKQKVDDELVKVMEKIKSLTSMDQLESLLGKHVTGILYLLTDGHPLDWLLGHIKIDGKPIDSLDALKQRADKVLALMGDKAHQEIRKIITLAKSKFPLNDLLSKMQDIDVEKLKTMTDKRITGFIERLIGKSLDKISESELGKAVKDINKTLNSIDKFKTNLYDKIKETLHSTLKVSLHLGYNKAKENDALLDVELNLQEEKGKQLMKAAGCGDFSRLLKDYDPAVMWLNEGVLTHKVTRKTTLSFNIIGWHKDFKYQNMTQLITDSEQHIKSEDNGMLTVTTDINLEAKHDRSKNGERIYTNMTLGFVGASKGTAVYDQETHRYLVDHISGMSSKYELLFEEKNTTPQALGHFLDYAVDFGIRKTKEDAMQALTPTLSKDAKGSYGSVSMDYLARFTEAGLSALFSADVKDIHMRLITRTLTLANYLNSGEDHLIKLGWCYWTPGIYDLWKKEQDNFTVGPREFKPVAPSPLENRPAPASVTLDTGLLFILTELYAIEDHLVAGFSALMQTLRDHSGLSPLEYEKKLAKFGKALNAYDKIDACVNTFFALIDALIKATGEKDLRDSSLTLKSQIEGQSEKTKMLTPLRGEA